MIKIKKKAISIIAILLVAAHGFAQNSIINISNTSPYYDPEKFELLIGGFFVMPNAEWGYGQTAVKKAPDGKQMLLANYIGGFDGLNIPGSPTFASATEEQDAASAIFDVLPNPFSHTLRIRLKIAVPSATVHVHDILGRVLYSQNIGFGEEVIVDTRHWTDGVWSVKLENGLGLSWTKKIVKQ